jgi:hypothetical protein
MEEDQMNRDGPISVQQHSTFQLAPILSKFWDQKLSVELIKRDDASKDSGTEPSDIRARRFVASVRQETAGQWMLHGPLSDKASSRYGGFFSFDCSIRKDLCKFRMTAIHARLDLDPPWQRCVAAKEPQTDRRTAGMQLE